LYHFSTLSAKSSKHHVRNNETIAFPQIEAFLTHLVITENVAEPSLQLDSEKPPMAKKA
jgi:hypothetical protein